MMIDEKIENKNEKSNSLSAQYFYEIIYGLCKHLVATPEELKVVFEVRDGDFVYVVSTKSGEQGQIIGKEGGIISAICKILRSIAGNTGSPKIFVEVDTSLSKEQR